VGSKHVSDASTKEGLVLCFLHYSLACGVISYSGVSSAAL
jgi:hypothetical protein